MPTIQNWSIIIVVFVEEILIHDCMKLIMAEVPQFFSGPIQQNKLFVPFFVL